MPGTGSNRSKTTCRRPFRAREGLIQGWRPSEPRPYTYVVLASQLLDCAPSLDDFVTEVEAGLAFARRTGNDQIAESLAVYRWLVSVLRGEAAESPADEASYLDWPAGHPVVAADIHITRALAAALSNDQIGLVRHMTAAMPLPPALKTTYPSGDRERAAGTGRSPAQARAAAPDARSVPFLADLTRRRLAGGAAGDAPLNFQHLLRLVEAERAWAAGDFAPPLSPSTPPCERPQPDNARGIGPWSSNAQPASTWPTAWITPATPLLATARQAYLAWGAAAKVDQLDWAYPTLRPIADATEPLRGPNCPPN